MNCSQCGKPAVSKFGQHPLCVDCYLKFQQANQIRIDALTRDLNFIVGQFESMTGRYGVLPRYETRTPTVNTTVGRVAFNNITVADSVVGSINTGDVKQIDVAMDHINQRGDAELAGAMQALTEAVINAGELEPAAKDEIIEQLSFVASQLALPKEKRRPGLVKPVLAGLAEAVNVSASLAALWDKFGPLISAAFGA